jgi:hypothetical protein
MISTCRIVSEYALEVKEAAVHKNWHGLALELEYPAPLFF